MQIELAEKLVGVLGDMGHNARVYENYSGRFMYGKSTTGVETDAPITEILRSVIMFADEFVDGDYAIFEEIDGIRVDNLGLNMIYY